MMTTIARSACAWTRLQQENTLLMYPVAARLYEQMGTQVLKRLEAQLEAVRLAAVRLAALIPARLAASVLDSALSS